MKFKSSSLKGFTCALAAAAFTLVGSVNAQQIVEGTIGNPIGLGYIASFDNVNLISGTSTVPVNGGVIFCLDGSLHWPGSGNTRTYTVVGDDLAFRMPQGGSEKALGMLNYVIDNYYDTLLTDPRWELNPGYGLNLAIWEIVGDFNGTLASLSTTAGTTVDSDPSRLIYTTAIADLQANFNTISSDYRSTKYDIQFLIDDDPAFQPLLLITPASAVPEASGVALALAGGLLLTVRRNRRA